MFLLKTLHFKLCLQSALSFGRSNIKYNVKCALEMLLESKGKRTRSLETITM